MRFDITASSLTASRFRPLHAGDDYDYTFSVKTRAGVAVNLTGAFLWMSIKHDKVDPDSDAVLGYSSADADQISITAPTAGGVFVVHFDGADTKDLVGTWDYDIKARLSGRIVHLAYGRIEFLSTITQARS